MPVAVVVEVHLGFLEALNLALTGLGAQNRTALIHKQHSWVGVGDVVYVGIALERWEDVVAEYLWVALYLRGSFADDHPLCLQPLNQYTHRHPPQISMILMVAAGRAETVHSSV